MIKKVLSLILLFSYIFTAFVYAYDDNAWKKVNGKFISSDGSVIKGAIKKGIDVSEWQGKIDWKIIKESDVDFAILRAGYGKNEKSQDDKYFEYNAESCTELDIPFGVYIYSYATSIESAKSEADHVLRLIKDYKLSYPVYYDMEDKVQKQLNPMLLGDIAEAFCKKIINAGYEVGIYSNKNMFIDSLWDLRFSNPKWHKWVAQYGPSCTYKGTYDMWQATDEGVIDGIEKKLDFNFYFGEVKETGDLPSEWAIPYINRAIAKDLLPKEYRNNYKKKIKRLEFCELAYNLLDVSGEIKEDVKKNPFKDTNSKAIVSLYNMGVIKGKSETRFHPDDLITREELAVVLTNIAKVLGHSAHQDIIYKYNDSEKISPWAVSSVNTMYIFDVMRGNNNKEFCPKDNTTKEEAIITIYNMYIVVSIKMLD